jgi:hypothetical protein
MRDHALVDKFAAGVAHPHPPPPGGAIRELKSSVRHNLPEVQLKVDPFICQIFVIKMVLDFGHIGGDVNKRQ